MCFFLIPLVLLAGCKPRGPEIVKRTQFVMGTLVEITVVAEDSQATADAITQAFQEMQRVEKLMSRSMEGSEVRRINRAASANFPWATRPTYPAASWPMGQVSRQGGRSSLSMTYVLGMAWGNVL